MKIKLTSIMVDDQAKALRFYTEVLGFQKKLDFPVGEYRWITVFSPEGHPDVELALEPNANPAGKAFQAAMFEQGIPVASFESSDLAAEARRLKEAGVVFTQEPADMGAVKTAIFVDTCGNLVQIHQPV
jgi:glyoxylase I family protein